MDWFKVKNFNKFIDKFGWFGLLRVFIYPFSVLVTTSIRLVQALYASRVLLLGRWKQYSHFNPHMAVNNFFYWIPALGFHREGRKGTSQYVGSDGFDNSRWFQYTLISLFSYCGAGAVTIILSMLTWWMSHFIWLESVDTTWLVTVLVLALISTSFYWNTFSVQNYNAMGFAAFPIGLFALFNEYWLLATIAWFIVSLGSFTAVVLAGYICFVFFLDSLEPMALLVPIPAAIKLLSHFLPLITADNNSGALHNIVKLLGANQKTARYKRDSSRRLGIINIYQILLFTQFALVFYLVSGVFPSFVFSVIFIYLVNAAFIRFADPQTVLMFAFSVITCLVLMEQNLWLLISYWLVVSPLPLLQGYPAMPGVFDVVPKAAPYDIQPVTDQLNQFMETIGEESRVLFAFDDPDDKYENLFLGQRSILEAALYVADVRRICLFPDWWAIYSANYEGASDWWGRSVDDVVIKLKEWDAGYVIAFTQGEKIDKEAWKNQGFECVSELHWNKLDFKQAQLFQQSPPSWYLMKAPQRPDLAV